LEQWETEDDCAPQEVNTLVKQLSMAPETWINVMGIAPETPKEPVCTPTRESAGPVAAGETRWTS